MRPTRAPERPQWRFTDDPAVSAERRDAPFRFGYAHDLAISADTPMWDQACFHAQQCAEKALKALFVAFDLEVPRSHDLVFLIGRLSTSCPSIDALDDAAALLTQHGVAPRHPGYLASETETDATTALAHARAIREFALKQLGTG